MGWRGELKQVFGIASVYTAVIVGAGFATGRELVSFFLHLGGDAIKGLLLSGGIMAVVGWAALDISRRQRLEGFPELIGYAAGRHVGYVLKLGCVAMIFVFFVAMLSATGALGGQLLGLPAMAGATAMAVLCFAALLANLDGLVRINSVLAPLMLVGSIALGVYAYVAIPPTNGGVVAGRGVTQGWVAAAIIYASYNMATAVGILAAMGAGVRRVGTSILGVMLGAGAVTVIALAMSIGLARGYWYVYADPIPFLRLLDGHGIARVAYVVVLLIAIYTTATSNAFCFYTQAIRHKGVISKAALCLAALAFSQVEFTAIVEIVYPLFGLVGILLGILIVLTRVLRG